VATGGGATTTTAASGCASSSSATASLSLTPQMVKKGLPGGQSLTPNAHHNDPHQQQASTPMSGEGKHHFEVDSCLTIVISLQKPAPLPPS